MTNQCVLITGGNGYIGSHLIKRLLHSDWEIHLLVRASSKLNLVESMLSHIKMHVIPENEERMALLLDKIRPDVVFHLASLFLVDHDPSQVTSLIESNVLFGTQLLEAMSVSGVTNFVNTSSYWSHYQGEDYHPVNLYAASKKAFIDILEYYVDAKSIHAVTLELCDTYGPDDPRPKVLNLLKRISQTGERLVMSPGMQKLDLVHVEDVANAYLHAGKTLLAKRSQGHIQFAVRTGKPITLRALVSMIEEVSGKELDIEWGGRPYRTREVMEEDNSILSLPGWKAQIDLKDGLASIF